MSKQEKLEIQLWDIIDEVGLLGDEDLLRLFDKALNIQYELGRASVYNENGWDYFDED